MINALRFVQGAVTDKDYVPELSHFRINSGHIMGFNGRLSLCSPIDLDFDVSPKASTFTKALMSCGDNVALSLTPNGRLSVRSDGFRVYVECLEDYAFNYYPVGDPYPVPPGFIDGLKSVFAFVGQDASRPWSMAVHLNGGSLYATNNIVAVQYWLGGETPTVTIPHNAVKELLRIGQEPISMQSDGFSLTFWYGQGKWLRTQLVEAKWPLEQFKSIFDKATDAETEPVNEELFRGLEKLKPFTTSSGVSRIFLLGDRIVTDTTDDTGAVFEVEGLPSERAFNRNMLALVGTVAQRINLEAEPAFFTGDRIRGVLMGMKV